MISNYYSSIGKEPDTIIVGRLQKIEIVNEIQEYELAVVDWDLSSQTIFGKRIVETFDELYLGCSRTEDVE